MTMKITSKRGRLMTPTPSVKPEGEWSVVPHSQYIVIKPDGSWEFPDLNTQPQVSNDEETRYGNTGWQQLEND